MSNKNNSSYRMVVNTYYERLLEIAENIYRGRMHEISKRIGLKPVISKIHSKSHRYPHIAEVEYKGETVRFNVHSDPERPTSFKDKVLDRIIENVNQDDVYFDIGAGTGSLSCVVGCHLNNGKVFAFEPLPENSKAIKRNFDQNKMNGEVFQIALSNTEKEINLNLPLNYGAGYTNAALSPNNERSTFWDDKKKEISVQAKRGDSLIQEEQIPTPNIISIDAEGAEMNIIQGLKETLSNDECRLVFVEVHAYLLGDFGTSADEIEKELQDFGFDLERFDERVVEVENEKQSLYRIAAHK